MNASRRHFLHTLGRLAASGAVRPAALPLAAGLAGVATLAQRAGATGSSGGSTGGYKALVCLFLHGGNDAHNWLVPADPAEHNAYTAARAGLGLPRETLLPLPAAGLPAGRSLALAPPLADLHTLYLQGRAALLANVGPLDAPITKADYQARRHVPARLFSHNDQQSVWQSLSPEGARSGWGGRMGDLLASANAQPVFTAVSAAGNAVFLTGRDVVQYQVNASGPVAVAALGREWLFGSRQAGAALHELLQDAGSNPFQQELTRVMQRGLAAEALLKQALAGAPQPTLPARTLALSTGLAPLAEDPLAQQLQMVARLIAAHGALGMQRQVFMVSLGGFDTHARQLADHHDLSLRVAAAVRWFDDTMQALGLGQQVALFTASDFGRTLTSNGDGSDHGWGAHHFVVGGGVLGGRLHGRMPAVALGTADEVGSGRLLPSTGVVQLAAALGSWLGVPAAALPDVLPGLQRFDAMGALFA